MTDGLDFTELKELLKDSPAFSILSDEELHRFTQRFELRHFTLGQTVCRAGDVADSFYVVYSGRARVVSQHDGQDEVTVGTLTRGNTFGEQGLLTNSRRHFTVRAAGDLSLLRLDKSDFDKLLRERPELREYFDRYISDISVRNFLKLCTVFSALAPHEIRDILGSMQTRDYAAGETIIREGDPGGAFYVLRAGSARVVKESAGGKVLAHLKAGDAFGELALLTGQPRAASVVAREPSSVFRLDRESFERVLASTPKFKDALVSKISGYADADTAGRAEDERPARETTEELPEAPPPPEDVYKPRRARRYPALLQFSEMDCGAASLAMVLRAYGKHVSINRLRDMVNVTREGAALYSIAEAAESLGFHTRGIRATYEHLLKIELPAIAHWEGYHYVVLYEARDDRVVVADPAIGLRRLTREEFEKGWTGYLLLFEPTPRLEEVEESKTTYGRFLPMLRPYRRLLFEIFLASLLLQLFGLATPVFTQVIVDKVLVHKSTSMLNLLLVGMLIVALFQTATTALRFYLLVHTTRRLDMTMVVNFYKHILGLPMRYFEERKVGDIMKRFGDNARIRDFLTGRALGVVLDTMMIFVYLALMLYYNAKLSLVALLFIPLYVVLTAVYTPIFKRQFRESFEKSAKAESRMVEFVTGMNTVKATAAERRMRWNLEGLIVKSLNVQFRSALSGMWVVSAANLLQTLNIIILFWYGARLVIAGELSVGQLVAFNLLVANVTRPIVNLVDLWREFQETNIAFERLNEVFDAKPEEDPAERALIRLPRVRGHVRFENVTFRYPTRPDKNALQNINLEILPGQTVALVGRSGSGKTTFANMLLRLHQPNEGRIFVDGYDLRQVSLSSLRAQIGVVPQDVFLFSGTIRENIAFGDPDAPLEQVVGAAMLAGAHDFISELPYGYEAVIGERGQSLSGGQKQRIAIARTLFKKPRILVFDEATSALDTESERAIQQNLDEILKDRTTLIIAHRLSTVRNADLIVVMDRGTVRETGDHYTLMQQKGLYYYLNSQQLEG
ncbi:MAG TPA: peptidase domain-containing ABC transporter [Pyrinomonadaceae bacterium]|nr:peptidase domain-containing ABC transporter [Pyrinomonadaceae bacterium]